jgi:hypothetical protein
MSAGKGAVVRLESARIYNVHGLALGRAAATSTARVSCGCRSVAAISAASTVAKCKDR